MKIGGIENTPRSNINGIRTLLNGYGTEPAFLKELIQNADDAHASWLGIFLLDKAEGLKHPLLNGPLLVIANNSTFEPHHEDGLRGMGLGTKGGDSGSIGKFGLGIKSVFLVVEAIFYAALNRRGDPSELNPLGFLNPWSGLDDTGGHPDWDLSAMEAGTDDMHQIVELLGDRLAEKKPAFLLVLPLRTQRTVLNQASLHTGFPGDDSESFWRQLVETFHQIAPLALPMLGHLRNLELWRKTPTASDWNLTESATLDVAASRPFRLPGEIGSAEDGNLRTTLKTTKVEMQVLAHCKWCLAPGLLELPALKHWPRASRLLLQGDAREWQDNVPDPSVPQAGVTALWRSLPNGEGGKLRIFWAVFLPIGEPYVSLPLPAPLSIDLLLHGCFYLDDKRTGLDGLEHNFPHTEPDSLQGVRRQWNRLLATKGTLFTVFDALEALAADLPEQHIQAVVRALRNSRLWQNFSSDLASQHVFGKCLDQHEVWRWRAVPRDGKLRTIRWYGEAAAVTPVLPGLAALARQLAIVLEDEEAHPALLSGASGNDWQVDDVKQLLHGLAADHFQQRNGSLPVLEVLLHGLKGEAMEEAWRCLDHIACLETDSANRAKVVSPSEARILVQEKRLFSSDYASLLQPTCKACPEWKPSILRSKLPEALVRLDIRPFDLSLVPATVLSSKILGTFTDRVNLTRLIYSESNDAGRYLLHGSFENRLSLEKLYVAGAADHHEDGAILKHILTEHSQGWRWLPTEADFNHGQRNELGLLLADTNGLLDLLREVGPVTDFSDLSTNQCRRIHTVCSEDLLRDLRVHELKGEPRRLTKADGSAYLEDDELHLPDGSVRRLWDELAAETRMVRPLTDPGLKDKQKRVFQDHILDASGALIRICQQTEPAHYWPLIMALLAMGTPRSDACNALRQAHWLPLSAGEFTNPANIVQIEGADEAIHALISAAADGASSYLSVVPELRAYPGAKTLKSHIIAQGHFQEHLENALELLSTALSAQVHRTGIGESASVSDWEDMASSLSDFDAQHWPLWPLFQALVSRNSTQVNVIHEKLCLPLAGRIAPAAYIHVLNWLALKMGEGAGAFDGPRFQALELLLKSAVGFGLWDEIRSQISLPNKLRRWKSTKDLVLEAQGVDDRYILIEDLRHLIRVDSARGEQTLEDAPAPGTAAHILRQYFDQFHSRTKARIGVLLSLLGGDPDVENLAREYSGGIEDLQERRRAIIPDMIEVDGRHPVEAISVTRFRPVVVAENTPLVFSSLAGPLLQIPLQSNPTTLLAGAESELWRRNEDGSARFNRLQLMPPSLFVDMDPDDVCAAIHAAAWTVIRLVYLNDTPDHVIRASIRGCLNAAMEKAEATRADMPLLLAQQMVLSGGGSLIQMLGLRRNALFREIANMWEKAKRLRAQAEAEGRNEEPGEARTLERKATQAMHKLLNEDTDAQRETLEAVRKKLEVAHYQPQSIPFELLQNADDAYLEHEKLGGQLCPQPFFHVEFLANSVRFSHAGRRINHPASESTLGYNRDLEKMVQLHVSDKEASQDEGHGAAVTGKFGLGFKSCLLACEAPAFVSGDLAVRIRGGVYPVHLESEIEAQLREALKKAGGSMKRDGTMFELPCEVASLEPRLERFVQLAPYATVCARRIRRITIGREAEQSFEWMPKPLGPVGNGTIGIIRSASDAVTLVCCRGGMEANPWQVLFRLDTSGFCRHSGEVPAVWVTMPVHARGGFGVVVNAPFDLNAGRTQLVEDSDKNRALALKIGVGLTGFLREWLNWTREEWDTARERMGLGADVTSKVFWSSAWSALTGSLENDATDDGIAALLRQILFQSHDGSLVGYARLLKSEAIVPARKGSSRLMKLQEIAGVLHGILDQDQTLCQTAAKWPNAPSAIREGRVVSADVEATIRQFIEGHPVLERLDLTCVLGAVTHGGVSLAKADALGRVLTKASWPKTWADLITRQEEKAVWDLLHSLRFLSAAGTFEEVNRLAADLENSDTPDEHLRVALAPPGRVLSSDYGEHALSFFLLCRERLRVDAEDLQEWIRNASPDKQTAVLRFLLKGDERVCSNVIERLGSAWFDSVWNWTAFTALPLNDQTKLRCLAGAFAGAVFKLEADGNEDGENTQDEEVQPPLEGITPEILLKWWKKANSGMEWYAFANETTQVLFDLDSQTQLGQCLKEGSRTPQGRQAWFRALVYCSLMGERVHREQVHRFCSSELSGKHGFFRLVIPPDGKGDAAFFGRRTSSLFDEIIHRVLHGANARGEEAILWRRIFYDARKMFVLVYEDDFPDRLLEAARKAVHADEWMNYMRNGTIGGQPSEVGVIGQSFAAPIFLLLRELGRLGVVENATLHELSIYPSGQVLRAARRIGFLDDGATGGQDYFDYLKGCARAIHGRFKESTVYTEFFGAGKRFDIPLLALEDLKRYDELQHVAEQ